MNKKKISIYVRHFIILSDREKNGGVETLFYQRFLEIREGKS
jgi:hypothetical protein